MCKERCCNIILLFQICWGLKLIPGISKVTEFHTTKILLFECVCADYLHRLWCCRTFVTCRLDQQNSVRVPVLPY